MKVNRLALLPIAATLLLGVHPLRAASLTPAPEPISPGLLDGFANLVERCPTFSWSEVAGAAGYELEIRRNRTETGAVNSLDKPFLARIRAGGLSWTPGLDACLTANAAYRWRVRALHPSGAGPWVNARGFRVEAESPRFRDPGRLLARLGDARLTAEQISQLQQLGWYPRPKDAQTLVIPTGGGAGPSLAETPAAFVDPVGNGAVELRNGDDYGVWARSLGVSVWGQTDSSAGSGIRGEIDFGEVTVSTVAVEGRSDALNGIGVFGTATLNPDNNSSKPDGVRGETFSGIGVHGLVTDAGGSTIGVQGQSASPKGRGICAAATEPGTVYGTWGESLSPSGFDFYAGGAGMDYGSFTGAHEARLDPSAPEPRPGMVLSLTGRTALRLNPGGSIDISSTFPTVALSDTAADPRVFGVYVGDFELPDDHWLGDRSGRFAVVNALGEGRVWVTDSSGPVEAGDYLTTSEVPGHAQRQDDRVLRSYTLGKAIESVDWDAVTGTVTHEGRTYKTALIAVVYTSG